MRALDFFLALGIAIVAGYGGYEYRNYTLRVDLCAGIETMAKGFKRELAPDHPCRPYL